jgi:hypothetical protein
VSPAAEYGAAAARRINPIVANVVKRRMVI